MTLLVHSDSTVSTHVGLLPQSERNESGAGLTLTAKLDMLSCEHVVHVDVELGPSLLELALLGRLEGNQVVVKTTSLIHLQHQTTLLGDIGLV